MKTKSHRGLQCAAGMAAVIWGLCGARIGWASGVSKIDAHALLGVSGLVGDSDTDYPKADHGAIWLSGMAANNQINDLTVWYFTTSDCSDGFLAQKATGGFTFISGETYYMDANGLYSAGVASGIAEMGSVQSILIQLTGDDSNEIKYCIPSVDCTGGACTSSTADNTTNAGPSTHWVVSFP